VSNPVFNDTSGTRISTIQWGSRIFLVVVVLLGAAVALTLSSHVSVPGLERFGPVPDSQELRPAVHRVRSNAPTEPAAARPGSSSVQPRPTTEPTTNQVGVPSVDAVKSTDARRPVGATIAPPRTEPSSAPSVRPTAGPNATAGPTGSSNPTAAAVGRGTEKPRNPQAAIPSAPGQNRTAKPRPTTLAADRRG
jgi:hypothetical protein